MPISYIARKIGGKMHKIQVNTNYLQNPNDECFSERPLEVEFHFDSDGYYTVENYYIDSKNVKIGSIRENNPSIDKLIDYEICHYISNNLEEVL